jgi:hypothetical protein
MLNTDFDMKEPRGWPGTALQVPMLDGEGGSTYMDCAGAQGSNTATPGNQSERGKFPPDGAI